MIRKYFSNPGKIKKDKIAWRSHEVTRIEAFSDGVFAFAVSLLVISLEVPKNSQDMLRSLWGFFPFTLTFLIVFWIWRTQYKFFRRYGLHDRATLTINSVLLIITLGFVYPLKFLFSTLFLPLGYFCRPQDVAPMVMLYNGGFAIIEFLFCSMYLNAYFKRTIVNLTAVETFETVSFAIGYLIPGFVSVIAVIIAFAERNNGWDKINICYMAYAALGILMPVFSRIRKKSFKRQFGNILIAEPAHNPEQ